MSKQPSVRAETFPAETGEGAFIWHQMERLWLKFCPNVTQCGKFFVMESMDIGNDMLLFFCGCGQHGKLRPAIPCHLLATSQTKMSCHDPILSAMTEA